MAIVQTAWGPKPTLTLAGGTPTTLAVPSQPLMGLGAGIRTGAGQVSYARLYRTQPWVASTANVLVRQVARLPLHTYAYADIAEEDRQRDKTHPAAIMLARPRPRRRGLHLRAEIAMSVFVQGTWVGWKRRPTRAAPPDQIWTLDWRYLTPHGDGGIVEWWEWNGRGVPGAPRIIAPEDIVAVAWNSPESDIGVSPLQQLGVTLRSEDALQRYAESSMRNGTRFGVAAILDKTVNADKAIRDGVREELMAAHGGVDQAFKPVVLGGGITDVKTLGEQSAVEAELIRQRLVNREEVAAVYGVPQPIAGILDHGTYSNVEELHSILYVTFLAPHLSMIAESIQAQLIDDEPAWAGDGVFVEFDLGEVLKGDTAERMNAYAVALQNGVLTINDVRRLENRPPFTDPHADEPLIAANNVRPLSTVGTDTGAAGGDVGKAITDVIDDAVSRAMDRTARAVGAGGKALDAFDRDRVERELEADLQKRGLNGTSKTLAAAVADSIAHDLVAVEAVDDVRALSALYARSSR